ncbi:MAG: YbjQ family protein [Rikenellaceae bacterium]
MIITTTPSIEGHQITKYHGVIIGETVMGANVFRDFMASMRDFFGGRSRSYEEVLTLAKDESMRELEKRALQIGANAVVGVKMDFEALGQKNGMMMVVVSGTAVTIE